jgi:glucan phosphorylase
MLMTATHEDPSPAQAAREQAQQVQEKVADQAQQAKSRVRDELDRRSTEAGQQVSSTADALRHVGDQLRSEGQEPTARLAQQASERADRVGSWLQRSSGEEILYEVEDLGRRQPLATLAAGAALGFVAARFLKASSQQRYASRGFSGPAPSTGGRTPTTSPPLLQEGAEPSSKPLSTRTIG